MTWTKLDDRYWMHPKIVGAGNEAVGIFSRLLSYCGCYETDGKIPLEVALSVAGSKARLDKLIVAGLLDELHDGRLLVHDYLDYNLGADELDAKREQAREAGRRGGLAKARRGNGNGR